MTQTASISDLRQKNTGPIVKQEARDNRRPVAGGDLAGLVCVLLTLKTISLSYAGWFPGPVLSGALASLTTSEFRCKDRQRQAWR